MSNAVSLARYVSYDAAIRGLSVAEIDRFLAMDDPDDEKTVNRLLDARLEAAKKGDAKELQRQPEKPRETGRETSERGGK